MDNLCKVLITCFFMLQFIPACIEGTTVVELELLQFLNPGGRDMRGQCCDVTCENGCNLKFLVCLNDTVRTGTDLNKCIHFSGDSQIYPNSSHVNFEENVGTNFTNPIVFVISGFWHGFSLKWFAFNVATQNTLQLISFVDEVVSHRPNRSHEEAIWYFRIRDTGLGIPSNDPRSFSYRVRMYCSENHYGSECGRVCVPADDDEHGHYTCSDEGDKICREGWADDDIEHIGGRFCNQPIPTAPTCEQQPKSVCYCDNGTSVAQPPVFTTMADKDIYYVLGKSIALACTAEGYPMPTYTWYKNDELLRFTREAHYSISSCNGTLVIPQPTEEDEAVYQCVAENSAGQAGSNRVHLQRAYLERFTLARPRIFSSREYQGFELLCLLPLSNPSPVIHWVTSNGNGTYTNLELGPRITTEDNDGILYFAHLLQSDAQSYHCVVENVITNETMISQAMPLRVQPAPQYQAFAPVSAFYSPTHQIALLGTTWKVECIFYGLPTPYISWRKTEGDITEDRRVASADQELVIRDLQFDDAGEYECLGLNDNAAVPTRRTIRLTVKAAPYWLDDVPHVPTVVASAGDTVSFPCPVRGIPEPTVQWFMNGILLQANVSTDIEYTVGDDKLEIVDVKQDASFVLQCNVSNMHGYLLTSMQLIVPCVECQNETARCLNRDCTVEQDVCASAPCRNGGTCISTDLDGHLKTNSSTNSSTNSTINSSTNSSTNSNTESSINPSSYTPITYSCMCTNGFTGELCDDVVESTIADEYWSTTQRTVSTTQRTVSTTETTVSTTQTTVNPCESTPCYNEGRCVMAKGMYSCICPPKFDGERCENKNVTHINVSETSVTDPCSPTPCRNGGECLIADGAHLQNTNFSCKCLADFSGDLCQNQRRESCENGICADKNNRDKESESEDDGNDNEKIIVAVVMTVLCAAVLISVAVCMLIRKRKNSSTQEKSSPIILGDVKNGTTVA